MSCLIVFKVAASCCVGVLLQDERKIVAYHEEKGRNIKEISQDNKSEVLYKLDFLTSYSSLKVA